MQACSLQNLQNKHMRQQGGGVKHILMGVKKNLGGGLTLPNPPRKSALDHKPLETIFNCPLAAAFQRLQSMMLMLQHYTFKVEYHQGSTLLITDTLSCAPLPTSSQKPVHNEMVYRVEFEADTLDLSGFSRCYISRHQSYSGH